MTEVASVIIIYAKESSEELKGFRDQLKKDLAKTRLRSYYIYTCWKIKGDLEDYNHKTTGNSLHRTSKHCGCYLTCPVIVNYDNVLTHEETMMAIRNLRYVDLGRFYLVNMNKDGTYTIDLYQNTNTHFDRFENVELLDPKEKVCV